MRLVALSTSSAFGVAGRAAAVARRCRPCCRPRAGRRPARSAALCGRAGLRVDLADACASFCFGPLLRLLRATGSACRPCCSPGRPGSARTPWSRTPIEPPRRTRTASTAINDFFMMNLLVRLADSRADWPPNDVPAARRARRDPCPSCAARSDAIPDGRPARMRSGTAAEVPPTICCAAVDVDCAGPTPAKISPPVQRARFASGPSSSCVDQLASSIVVLPSRSSGETTTTM